MHTEPLPWLNNHLDAAVAGVLVIQAEEKLDTQYTTAKEITFSLSKWQNQKKSLKNACCSATN